MFSYPTMTAPLYCKIFKALLDFFLQFLWEPNFSNRNSGFLLLLYGLLSEAGSRGLGPYPQFEIIQAGIIDNHL